MLFAAYLDGGIEREALADGSFRRVNSDALRSLGLETELTLPLPAGFELGGHWLQLSARRQVDGRYNAPVEDRPDYQGALFLSWERRGLRAGLEAERIGPRQSGDSTDAIDGLRPLAAQGRVNLLVAYQRYLGGDRLRDIELRLRLDNLADASVESQTGLPEPGRRLSVGLRMGMGL